MLMSCNVTMFLVRNANNLIKSKRNNLQISLYPSYFYYKNVIANVFTHKQCRNYIQLAANSHKNVMDGTARTSSSLNRQNELSTSIYKRRFIQQSKNNIYYGNAIMGIFPSLLCRLNKVDDMRNQSIRYYSNEPVLTNNVILNKLFNFWKAVSESAAAEFTQDSLVWIHMSTGLPWWTVIFLSAFTLRVTFTLPIAIYTRHLFHRIENIQKQMGDISERILLDTRYRASKLKWSNAQAKRTYTYEMSQEYKKLILKNNCHPMKIFLLPMLQIPFWVILSISVRNMCTMMPRYNEAAKMTYLELSTEGFGWITNLTVPDQYIILPMLLMSLNVALCEIPYLTRKQTTNMTITKKVVHNIFRILSVASGVVAMYIPSGVTLLWTSLSSMALGQIFLTASPKVRTALHIPTTKLDPDIQMENLFPWKKITDANIRNTKMRKNKFM